MILIKYYAQAEHSPLFSCTKQLIISHFFSLAEAKIKAERMRITTCAIAIEM